MEEGKKTEGLWIEWREQRRTSNNNKRGGAARVESGSRHERTNHSHGAGRGYRGGSVHVCVAVGKRRTVTRVPRGLAHTCAQAT